MALTEFQRGVCRLLADARVRSGESYVAGGAALDELLRAPRRSRDLDLFHDTEQALAASWQSDRETLAASGYSVSIVRERPTFVEAEVRKDRETVIVQWAHDSAYRFFPLVKHDEPHLTSVGRAGTLLTSVLNGGAGCPARSPLSSPSR